MKKVILLIMTLLGGMSMYSVERRYYNAFSIEKNSLFLTEIDTTSSAYTLEVRAALEKNQERGGMSKQKWGVKWGAKSSESYYYVSIQSGNTDYGDFLDKRYAQVTVGYNKNGTDSVIVSTQLYEGVNMATGYNSILMEWRNGVSKIFVGGKGYIYVSSIPVEDGNKGCCGIVTNEKLSVQSMSVVSYPDVPRQIQTEWSTDKLDEYFKTSQDSIEGYWEYLDRDCNDKKARVGGRYKLALIKESDHYKILYVSGAQTNAQQWKCGMVKGVLHQTIFQNHYDLNWCDSMFEHIKRDAHADITENAILTLWFPVYDTSIRFSKVR